jgi:uncharacterized protein YceK
VLAEEIMNKLVLGLVILLSGCSQLMHGARQPVQLISSKGIYKTTCAGAVEAWNDCYDKARETCGGNYREISREDNNTGSRRELIFQCKK